MTVAGPFGLGSPGLCVFLLELLRGFAPINTESTEVGGGAGNSVLFSVESHLLPHALEQWFSTCGSGPRGQGSNNPFTGATEERLHIRHLHYNS